MKKPTQKDLITYRKESKKILIASLVILSTIFFIYLFNK